MQSENERQRKKIEREHSSVSTEELFSLITEASSWIHSNYVPDCIYHVTWECSPELDHLFLIRLTSSKQSVLTRVNFIVEWEEFAKSIKLLISVSGRVHTENMSSINLFLRNGSHAVVVSQRKPRKWPRKQPTFWCPLQCNAGGLYAVFAFEFELVFC